MYLAANIAFSAKRQKNSQAGILDARASV
jgi:hypothetical protein